MKRASNRPAWLGASAFLFTAALTACQSAPTRTSADLSRLQGAWKGYGPGGDCSVTISGNSLLFRARADFWYETRFTPPAGTDPRQLHATIIRDSSPRQADIGIVVVAIFEVEDGTLTLGVIEDFPGPPASPVAGDWDRAVDLYHLERFPPREGEASQPETGLTEEA